MSAMITIFLTLTILTLSLAHSNLGSNTFFSTYGPQVDLPFTGPLSFAHLPYSKCLDPTPTQAQPEEFDVALLGMPFDTSVSYRPGARFGPFGIRAGSRRIRPNRSWTIAWGADPYEGGRVLDCGDVPVAISDNALALAQMEAAYTSLLFHPTKSNASYTSPFAKDGLEHPRIVTLGGDHTVVLPILRSLNEVYGKVTVIHFDSHLDTWTPVNSGVSNDENSISAITHGSFFWKAWTEGLMTERNVHAGIRCKFSGPQDLEHDSSVGFALLTTDDIDHLGSSGIAALIRERVGDGPVYLSVDIDVLDPAFAPATGTPEAGGWTVRELKAILRGLQGLNFVGADIVEVAPGVRYEWFVFPASCDAEGTAVIAADLVHEFVSMFLAQGPVREARDTWAERGWVTEFVGNGNENGGWARKWEMPG
ncbi:Arginase/deacetylase [Dacryopinax primogenitus]|uniref:Arginase/deacetylase n=1 Tax=Dacryopinax primogenitus (strain DJM 731) TaxID=1858805 RepID=M5G3H3_DACPD|nr:Arginase/deacetylase [Dacryopinax primogenitus]EJU02770.1 Arginase/deacetylase [Dacryopinax primogenitus]